MSIKMNVLASHAIPQSLKAYRRFKAISGTECYGSSGYVYVVSEVPGSS